MEDLLAIMKRTAMVSRSSILSSYGASRWRAMSAQTAGQSSGGCRYLKWIHNLLRLVVFEKTHKLLKNSEIVKKFSNCYPRSGWRPTVARSSLLTGSTGTCSVSRNATKLALSRLTETCLSTSLSTRWINYSYISLVHYAENLCLCNLYAGAEWKLLQFVIQRIFGI